jgi:DNA repair exonuclease SbcCD nuclease subunit
MAKYLLLSDLHLSDKAPSSCTDSYSDDLFDLLDQVRKLVFRHKVIAVIIAGDVFHNKAPSRTSHQVVRRFIAWCRGIRVPVFIVPGNHDIRNDRQESVGAQPLGVVFESGAAERLEGWGGYDAEHQYMVYGVPWQQDWATLSPALSQYRHPASATQPSLVVAHAPLYPPGKELSFEFYPSADWAKHMGERGYVYYGHVHEPHGVWQNEAYPEVTFANFGALSRGSLHEYNLTRDVGVTLWDDDDGSFEFVPLDAKPAEQVFRLHEKQQYTDMHGRLDEFLGDIKDTELGVVTAEGVIERIRAMGLTAAEVAVAEELLAEAHHEQKGTR